MRRLEFLGLPILHTLGWHSLCSGGFAENGVGFDFEQRCLSRCSKRGSLPEIVIAKIGSS